MAKARDIMNREVEWIDRNATAMDAIARINDLGVAAIMVTPDNPGDTFGILTMRDVFYKVVAIGRPLADVKVYEIMTKPVIVVMPDLKIKHVARLFANNRIAHAPVVEDNEVVGMISIPDIIADAGLLDTLG